MTAGQGLGVVVVLMLIAFLMGAAWYGIFKAIDFLAGKVEEVERRRAERSKVIP